MTTFDSLDAAFGRRRIRTSITVEREDEDVDLDVAGNYIFGADATWDAPGYDGEADDVVAVEYIDGKGYMVVDLSDAEARMADDAIEKEALYRASWSKEEGPRRRRGIAGCW